MKSSEFDSHVVIVTGGGGGSGLEIVKKFLELGSKVYSLDVSYKKKINIKNNLIEIKINLSKVNEIKKISQYILKKEKKIKCIVNNAGVSLVNKNKNFQKYWDLTLDINVRAPYLLVNYLKNRLIKNNSSIINITSIASKTAMYNNPAYNSSKAALAALTLSQALDFASIGVRANAVCPGYIKTRMTNKSFKDHGLRRVRTKRMMIERYGEPEDVANAVLFLASQNSKYINGEEIVVDGGLTKKGI